MARGTSKSGSANANGETAAPLTGSFAELQSFNEQAARVLSEALAARKMNDYQAGTFADLRIVAEVVGTGAEAELKVEVLRVEDYLPSGTDRSDLTDAAVEKRGVRALREGRERLWREVRSMSGGALSEEQVMAILREMGFGNSLPEAKTTISYTITDDQGHGDYQSATVVRPGELTEEEVRAVLDAEYPSEFEATAQRLFGGEGTEIKTGQSRIDSLRVRTELTWPAHSEYYEG